MNEHRNQDRLPESACPLGPVSEFEKDSRSFYFSSIFHRQYQGRFKPEVGEQSQTNRSYPWPAGVLEFEGSGYRRIPGPDVVWHQAEDDVNLLSLKMGYKPQLTPRHFHAAFLFQLIRIHLDYVKFIQWGPLSGVEEFLVFSDGRFISRGGNCGIPPAGGSINWPLALLMGNGLITIEGPLKTEAMELKGTQVGFWTRLE
jgi:hypothetical protein